ncbi:MAG: DUF6577 family protein [Bacteroidota bacterium]
MKDKDFIDKLQIQFKDRPNISTEELHSFFKKEDPGIPDSTIAWRIYNLKNKGILTHIGRATYSIGKSDKENFIPTISAQEKKIYSQIKSELPYLKINIWDTRTLNSFMVHQMGRYFLIVETEKDGMEPIFNLLSENNKNVFLNPDKKTLELYSANFKECIIIHQLISEAPTIEVQGVVTSSIEKLLVDCIAEKEILSGHREELDNIFNTAGEKYNVSIKSAQRYARRRGQLPELQKLFYAHLKNSLKRNNTKK